MLLPSVMSNHHDTVIYDPHGTYVEFMEQRHKLFAKAQNCHRGRWENLWSSEPPCVVHLVDAADVMDRLVYAATNPVKDGLVERVHHWPGVNGLSALNQRPIVIRRPRHFFRAEGKMPEVVTLELTIPAELGDRDEFLAALRRRVAKREDELRVERAREGKGVLGRRGVLRPSWRACPTSREPRRGLRPRVAARSVWSRIEALQRNAAFLAAYREARAPPARRLTHPVPLRHLLAPSVRRRRHRARSEILSPPSPASCVPAARAVARAARSPRTTAAAATSHAPRRRTRILAPGINSGPDPPRSSYTPDRFVR